MKYPCLVLKQFCNTPIQVVLEEMNVYGEPETVFDQELMCNYQSTGKTVLTADKRLIQLSGIALLPGDIAPEVPNLSGGTATIHGQEWKIYEGTKARNPDGTVNYTELRFE